VAPSSKRYFSQAPEDQAFGASHDAYSAAFAGRGLAFPPPNTEASLRALEWALHSARLQAGTAGAETLVLLPHSHTAAATDLRTHPLLPLVATTPLHSPAFALTLPASTAAPRCQSAPSDDPATWDDAEAEDEPDTGAAPCKPLSFDIYLVSSMGAPTELLRDLRTALTRLDCHIQAPTSSPAKPFDPEECKKAFGRRDQYGWKAPRWIRNKLNPEKQERATARARRTATVALPSVPAPSAQPGPGLTTPLCIAFAARHRLRFNPATCIYTDGSVVKATTSEGHERNLLGAAAYDAATDTLPGTWTRKVALPAARPSCAASSVASDMASVCATARSGTACPSCCSQTASPRCLPSAA
jgi:hypothetical protein